MWSLPDIQSLNARAARDAEKTFRTARKRKAKCHAAEYGADDCRGPVRGTPYYDIFSDDPKGVHFACKHHEGDDAELFHCDGCSRLMITNYTWEFYRHADDDGDTLCLNCYAKRVIANGAEWIDVSDEGQIVDLDFETVRRAKHIFAVAGPRHGLDLVGSVTLDHTTGGRIYQEDTPDGGVEELRQILHRAHLLGHARALLVMDGAFQFCASIGVYVEGVRS